MRSQPDAGPPHHPCQKTMQSARWAKILCHAREPREHFVLFFDRDGRGASILPAVRRATIPVKNNTTCTSRLNLDHLRPPRDHSQVVFDRDGGGAGIWPAVCRPTRHHDGHPAAIAPWCSTRMVGGRHVLRCVLSRARAHLAHSGRAPNVARLARLEHAAHLAHVEHVAHLAHQTCLARLGPRGPWRTCRAWHAWRTSPQRRAHGVGFGSQ